MLLRAERSDPLPNVAAYATPEAIGVTPLPLSQFRDQLSELSLDLLLPFLSDLQARLSALDRGQEKELHLAETIYGKGEASRRFKAFVRNGPGRRTIFCEQALTLLQWLAIADCSEDPVQQVSPQHAALLQRSLLGAPAYLEPASQDMANKSRAARWLPYLTQNLAFNGHPVVPNAMARTWAILGQLHRSADDLRPNVDIDGWLTEDYGLTLEQQMTLGFALYARMNADDDPDHEFQTWISHATLEETFDQMQFSPLERQSGFKLMTAPIDHFREELEGLTVEQASWAQVPFMRHPLIEITQGRYLLQSPRALLTWLIEGPFYRALDSARDRGERAVINFTSRIGRLTERYVLNLVESAHREPRLPGAGKVYGDKTYGRGSHSSDVTITYPNEAILFEVASHRLTLRSKRDGDPEALRHDLTEMVGRRPKQLQRCIDAIKPLEPGHQATLRFPHLEPERIARFWPIIITTTPVQWSFLIEDFIGADLEKLESRSDVEPLDVLAIEDLEQLLAISEQTGRLLPDLLAAKASGVGPHGDIRTWVEKDSSIPNIARPSHLDVALKEVLDVTGRLLGFDDLDEEDEIGAA